MQNENLKKGVKTQFKSGGNAAENGRKGGLKAQENRRRRKEIKKTLQDMMDETFTDNNGNVLTGIEKLSTTLFKIATDPKHKQVIQAQRLIYELTGMDKSDDDKKRIKQALKLQEKELELMQQKIDANDEWG